MIQTCCELSPPNPPIEPVLEPTRSRKHSFSQFSWMIRPPNDSCVKLGRSKRQFGYGCLIRRLMSRLCSTGTSAQVANVGSKKIQYPGISHHYSLSCCFACPSIRPSQQLYFWGTDPWPHNTPLRTVQQFSVSLGSQPPAAWRQKPQRTTSNGGRLSCKLSPHMARQDFKLAPVRPNF